MTRSRLTLGLIAVGTALLAAPAAQAATFEVHAGAIGAVPVPAGTPQSLAVNRFLPGRVQVHVGDTVDFMNPTQVPHTITFLGSAPYGPYSLVVPDPAKGTYAPQNDAAGNPFPFVGQPKFIYNLGGLLTPIKPKVVADQKLHTTGLFGKGFGPTTASIKFTKAGTYKFVCGIHPGMHGTIVVKPKGSPIASPNAEIRSSVAAEAAALRQGKALLKTKPPANTVFIGVGTDVTLFQILPAKLTVPAGTTVTFRNPSTTEIHNLALGPKAYLKAYQKLNDKFPNGPKDPNQVSPDYVYSTEVGGGYGAAVPYDGTNHGNGFLSLAGLGSTPLLPFRPTEQITFTKPGKYTIYCLIHFPGMTSTITVT